jgi:hypothetical protein
MFRANISGRETTKCNEKKEAFEVHRFEEKCLISALFINLRKDEHY